MARRAGRVRGLGWFAAVVALAVLVVNGGARAEPPAGAPAEPPLASAIRYEVTASADGAELSIEAQIAAGLGADFTTDPQAREFAAEPAIFQTGRWIRLPAEGDAWRAPSCQREGCRLRYVFHLRAASQAVADPDTAAVREGALVGPASTWLVRPTTLPPGGLRGRLRVKTTAPLLFVTGLPRVAGAADTYEVMLLPYYVSPYSAFGQFDRLDLRMGGAELEISVALPSLGPSLPRLRAWVTAAARAVTAYFGRYPVDHALVLVVPQRGGVHGKQLGGGGATVLLQIAPGAALDDPAHDWTAAHEMVHLAVPEMARQHLWLTEGLATYVEPLARALTGELRPESVWRDMMLGLPKGLPAPGDRGLDRTHTWGRTYWGGALFAFVADLEIRKATAGRQSLATALRGVLQAGGDTRVAWPIERFLAAADGALERPILTDLYHRMADSPVDVDLPATWRALGIALTKDGRIVLDEHAPLAAIRRQMIGPARAAP
jgi:hypothetical protein